MKSLQKILSVLIAVIMVASSTPFNAIEAGLPVTKIENYAFLNKSNTPEMVISVGNKKADLTDTDIIIPIDVKNNIEFSGFSFCIIYDHSRLELKSAEIAIEGGYKVINHPSGYDVGLAWTSEKKVSGDITIAFLHFSIKENAAPGKGFISLVFRKDFDSFYTIVNHEESDILCQVQNGFIEINGKTPGDINEDGKLNNKDVVILFRYVSNNKPDVDMSVCDFNKDNAVNNKDVVALFRYVSNNDVTVDMSL